MAPKILKGFSYVKSGNKATDKANQTGSSGTRHQKKADPKAVSMKFPALSTSHFLKRKDIVDLTEETTKCQSV